MILFFGTKKGKENSKKMPNLVCGHCGQKGTVTLYTQETLAHVFWLPITKIGTNHYAECSHCKRVYYKDDFSADMLKVISEK